MTFREYILGRRYNFGRGTDAAWEFLALAIGRDDLLDSGSLSQLEARLGADGAPGRLIQGARSAWRSYRHCEWRMRRIAPFVSALPAARQGHRSVPLKHSGAGTPHALER